MNLKCKGALTVLMLGTLSIAPAAAELDFSIAGGYPFVLVPEVSWSTKDRSQRWHVNYKAGLDDGISVGFEQSLSADNRHRFGVVVGAIGIKNEENPCAEQQGVLACVLANIFDEETINGVGVTYSFYLDELAHSGWHVKLEGGYGEGSKSDTKNTGASIRIGYQF